MYSSVSDIKVAGIREPDALVALDALRQAEQHAGSEAELARAGQPYDDNVIPEEQLAEIRDAIDDIRKHRKPGIFTLARTTIWAALDAITWWRDQLSDDEQIQRLDRTAERLEQALR